MPPVYVILVGGIDHGGLIRAERYIFGFELSRSQQRCWTAGRRHRIEVIPAILLGRKYDAIPRGELKRDVGSETGQRIVEARSALPDFVA
jgi:hypothetical protein